MKPRRSPHLDIARRSLAAWLSILSLAALAPAPLAAQAKSMTITGVAGVVWNNYDPDTGLNYYTLSFTVQNTGTQAAYVYVTPGCGELCDGSPSGVLTWLTPGQTATVPMWLAVDSPVTTEVQLTVVGYLGYTYLSASDSKSVSVHLSGSSAVILTPPRPSDVSIAPNGTTLNLPAGTNTFNFVITNNDHSASSAYTAALMTLWLRCGGFLGQYVPATDSWSSCGRYPGYAEGASFTGSATATHPDTLPITLTGTNGQRGYIRLVKSMIDPVTNAAVVDSASVLVLIGDQLTPEVTPKAGTITAAPRVARVDSFTVRNTGTVTATYAMSATCGSFTVGGCVANPSTVAIAAGATARIGVTYMPSATNGATSAIKLVATGTATGLAAQSDSGSINVTSLDAAAPAITIVPAQSSTLTAKTFTATVNVCDDGVVSNPVVTFNGVPLPDMFLRAPQSGCVTAGTSTFTLTAQPGTNTITVTDDDGYHTASATRTFTYDDATEVTPQVAAVLSTVKVPPGGATWTDTFTVRNPGPGAASYSLSGTCGSFAGCTVQPATLAIGPGQMLKATVGYSPPPTAGASSTIQLTATHVGANNHQVSASASVTSTTVGGALTQLTMTPADGATYSASTFTATVTWCDPDDAIASHQAWLGGVLLPNTFVAQTVAGCASAGTSTWTNLTLVPWDQLLLAQATDAAGHVTRVGHVVNYTPSLGAYQPQVTPKNVQTDATRGVVNGQTFQILNVGSLAATYQLSASCGAFTVCQLDKSTLTIAPGARDSARVTFLVPAAIGSFSPIKLVARYSSPTGASVADSGTVTTHTPTAYQLFQPRVVATYPLILVQPGWIPFLSYTITNTGSETATYTLTTTTPSDYSFAWPHIPVQSVTLAPGASYYMDVQPKTTTVLNRMDPVSVRASYTASDGTMVTAIDSTLINIRDGVARLRITTVSARNVPVARGYGGQVDGAFAVQNVGTYPLSVSISRPLCTDLLIWCTAPFGVSVDVGQTAIVPVSFKIGLSPNGIGTFRLAGTAGGPQNSTASEDSIRVFLGDFRAMSVTPDSAWTRVPQGDVGKQFLAIHNNGGGPAAYRYVTSCQDVQGQFFINTQTCNDSGWTSRIAPGDSAVVPVRYAAVSSLSRVGLLRLVAWDSSDNRITTQGRVYLQTAPVLPLVVSVAQAGASTTIARNQCLTIKAGDDAAYECGDLRLVHALPATTTLSRTRAPTLIYNSRDHSGIALFPADVSVSSGAQITQLVARIMIDGQLPETTTFAWNPQWNSRSSMRVVVPFHAREKGLPTGAYHYTLAVDGLSGGAPQTGQDTGTVAVVNRSKSEFGPGWWIDGYERLVFTSLPGRVLWVGGDGSTRLYTQVGTSNVWLITPGIDRPDSLVSASGSWLRRLRNGAYVMFNAAGLHTATVDSKQRVTSFNHDDAAHPTWLTSITLPVPIGSSAVRRYLLNHDATSGLVTSVDAPGVPVRRTSLQFGFAQSGDTVLTRILDADAVHSVGFAYASPGRLQTRTDRRGYSTLFAFDPVSGGFVGDTLFMANTAAANIALGFCGAETASLSSCARGPIDTSSVVTRFDGPRLNADVLDSAWFRVTRYGAPSLVTDALKNVTRIERADGNWPLLVTKTVDPAGFTTTASYDSVRALLLATTALNPRSLVGSATPGASATVTYAWHAKRDVATQMQSAEGVTTRYVYDSVSGDLLSQHVGLGTKRNVVYGYDAATRLVNTVTTLLSPTPTRYHYDALGNLDMTTTSRGLVSTAAHDYLGRDSVVRTPIEDVPTANWRQQAYQYDVNDRLLVATDSGKSNAPNSAMRLTVINDYDAEGNLTSVTRRAWPDSLNLGDLVLTSVFDAANRKTSDFDPYRGTIHSWTYDPAGNATVAVRGADTVTAEFDAMNRVTHRVVFGAPNNPFTPEAASDDQHFYYGARGELTRATNRNAEVRRLYSQSGAIVYDTSIAFATKLATPTVNPHFYGIGYAYDLDGRRTSMTPPSGLSVLAPVSYTYDPETGDLQTVSVQNGGSFRYVYNGAGLLDSLIQADGTAERHYYDDDGRETRRTEYSVALHLMLHDEAVGLDGRGRRTVVASNGLAGAPTETYTYDGLDGVLSASGRTSESTPRDPLGNARLRVNSTEMWAEQYLYEPHSTRLHYLARQLTENQWIDSLSQTHNLAGDLVRVVDQVTGPQRCVDGTGHATVDCPPPAHRIIAQSLLQNSYDADGHLLLSVKSTSNDGSGLWPALPVRDPNWFDVYPAFERGVTEEYRYDPLGRRIWVHAHRDAYCPTQRDRDSTTVCLSTVERTIYDGDQVIAEIRQPGDTSVSAAVVESDGIVSGALGAHFGQVGYVHGLGIDRPLELWRNYNTLITRLVTHYQWQGALELGTTLSGQLIQCGMAGAITPCENIDWPGAKIRFGLVWPASSLGPPSWWGTMAGMKQNATGMRDMRNRQYDPKTGRFTQEDPIGLAGGANLYGFAGGDPVNYDDPFGLCGKKGELPCKIDNSDGLGWARFAGDVLTPAQPVFEAATNIEMAFMPLGETGAITKLGLSEGRAAAVEQGIYEFTAASGKTYVGQSGSISQRLLQHVRSGKLASSDVTSVSRIEVLGGKTAREIVEQRRINWLGGIVNLENKVNPIGPARQHLLTPP